MIFHNVKTMWLSAYNLRQCKHASWLYVPIRKKVGISVFISHDFESFSLFKFIWCDQYLMWVSKKEDRRQKTL